LVAVSVTENPLLGTSNPVYTSVLGLARAGNPNPKRRKEGPTGPLSSRLRPTEAGPWVF